MNLTQPKSSHTIDWQRAHEELSRLAKTRARLDWDEGRALVSGLRSGVHVHLGFGSFVEYVERLFGYKPRWTEERLRVAEALDNLPELEQALRDGAIHWSTARELTRVAIADTEREWLDVARGRSLRQIEDLVAGHALGDRPRDSRDPSIRRHVLRFEVEAETFATFREAMGKIRHDAGTRLDDDEALLLVARHILGGPSDAGRANYQVALTVCENCGRGWQQGAGDAIEVNSEIVAMATCDAQTIGRLPNVTHVGEGAAAHMGEKSAATHVGEKSPATHDAVGRAHQRTRPAARRAVVRRDGGRCVVPGCKNTLFLDVHHIVLRSEGGDDDPDRMVLLCGAHHRAQHRGQLIIEGSMSTGLSFRHADGARYGAAARPRISAVYEDAFRGLRSLGFRESEVRAALERLRTDASMTTATLDQVLRAALSALTPPVRRAPADRRAPESFT